MKVAGRVVGRRVEGVEVVVLIVDFRPVGHGEPHTFEDGHQLFGDPGQRVEHTGHRTPPWERDIYPRGLAGGFLECPSSLVQGRIDGLPRAPRRLTNRGTLLLTEVADATHDRPQLTAAPGEADAKFLQGYGVSGTLDGSYGLFLKLFYLFYHGQGNVCGQKERQARLNGEGAETSVDSRNGRRQGKASPIPAARLPRCPARL